MPPSAAGTGRALVGGLCGAGASAAAAPPDAAAAAADAAVTPSLVELGGGVVKAPAPQPALDNKSLDASFE